MLRRVVALIVGMLLVGGCERMPDPKPGNDAKGPTPSEGAAPGGAAAPVAAQKDYAVSVYDNSEMGEENAGRLVRGFPSFELAREYARRRVRDSVEELRKPGIAQEELRKQWGLFGESAQVVGGGPGESYSGREELDRFLEQPATPEERDWQAVAKQAGIK